MTHPTDTPISIALCIPAYKAGRFLPRLLQAAKAQSVPFQQILVFDDASGDDTAEVARAHGAEVIVSPTNVGCSAGKNALARHSHCNWLHFHDADDSLDANFVAAATERIRSTAADVILFGFRVLDESSADLLGTRVFDRARLEADALSYVLAEQVNPFCGIYRRDAFLRAGGWVEDRDLMQCEDQAGHTSMALAGLTFSADARITVTNFANQGSMTNSNLDGAQRALVRYFARFAPRVPRQYLPIIGTRLWRIAGTSAAMNDWQNALAAAELAATLGQPVAPEGAAWFRAATRLSRPMALRVREQLIRWLRPSARANYRALWSKPR